MRERIVSEKKNIKISDSGKYFSYVVINDGSCYKKDSLKSIRKDDYMKYLKIAKKFNMKIDISYYLKQTVGMYICLINEDDKYQLFSSDKIMQIKDLDKREKEIDDYFQRKAKTGLKNI